jgi:single-strand selective monofunctional uracil DNA glycosylase
MELKKITDDLVVDLEGLSFGPPVTHVYNPLKYARKPYDIYLERYGSGCKKIVLIGMNPGPWGMAQTGVPFGEVNIVTNWLKIQAPVGKPENPHPKRPVNGFSCKKSEVSGKRLWGWVMSKFKTPEEFFSRFFIANYCPLLFFEKDGRNKTPNTIKAKERHPLLDICDGALYTTIQYFNPDFVVGIGTFAYDRAANVLQKTDIMVGKISHPSPANPKANRGWAELVTRELSGLGIKL